MRARTAGHLPLVVLSAALVIGASSRSTLHARGAVDPRGVWVAEATLQSSRPADIIDTARAGDANTLFVQVRDGGETAYPSASDPASDAFEPHALAGADPFGALVTAAHENGLKVYAWIELGLVTRGATLPISHDHVVFRHPEWLMIPRDLANGLRGVEAREPGYLGELGRWTRAHGATADGMYVSPVAEAARTYLASIAREVVVRYPVDGVHLDAFGYPDDTFDYSAPAIAEFRASIVSQVSPADRARFDLAATTDVRAWPLAFADRWTTFRQAQLTELLDAVRRAVKASRPDVVLSATIDQDPAVRARKLLAWRRWLSAGLFDLVSPASADATQDRVTLIPPAQLEPDISLK